MKQLTLENDIIRVIVCPSLGGKITSFYLKEKEFELVAQSSEAQYEARCRMSERNVIDSFGPYAYGMDDCFPNIDSEYVRKTYTAYINSAVQTENSQLRREYSTFDYYSTVIIAQDTSLV